MFTGGKAGDRDADDRSGHRGDSAPTPTAALAASTSAASSSSAAAARKGEPTCLEEGVQAVGRVRLSEHIAGAVDRHGERRLAATGGMREVHEVPDLSTGSYGEDHAMSYRALADDADDRAAIEGQPGGELAVAAAESHHRIDPAALRGHFENAAGPARVVPEDAVDITVAHDR